MKKYIILVFVFIMSCKKDNNHKLYGYKNDVLILNTGIYSNLKTKIHVYEITNGTITYAVTTGKRKKELIIQHNILEAFSKHHFWCLYWDEINMQLWEYNSDYNSKNVWEFDEDSKEYIEKNFCTSSLEIPIKFAEAIEKSSSKICE